MPRNAAIFAVHVVQFFFARPQNRGLVRFQNAELVDLQLESISPRELTIHAHLEDTAFLPKSTFGGLDFGCKCALDLLVEEPSKPVLIAIAVNDCHFCRRGVQTRLATFLATLSARACCGETRVQFRRRRPRFRALLPPSIFRAPPRPAPGPVAVKPEKQLPPHSPSSLLEPPFSGNWSFIPTGTSPRCPLVKVPYYTKGRGKKNSTLDQKPKQEIKTSARSAEAEFFFSERWPLRGHIYIYKVAWPLSSQHYS